MTVTTPICTLNLSAKPKPGELPFNPFGHCSPFAEKIIFHNERSKQVSQ